MDQARFLALNVSAPYSPSDTLTYSRRWSDIDQVALGRKLVIKQQSIGVASTAQGFNGVDGILGFVAFQV